MNRRSLLSLILLYLVSVASTIADPVIASASDDEARNQKVFAFLSNIDDETRKEFQKAWRIAGGGIAKREGVVLLYRMPHGSIQARSLGLTNEHKQFTFAWHPAIAAVVHTHPNSSNAQPSGEDIKIAARLSIPVCTITSRGLFVYDPATRKTAKLHDGLDWLNPSRADSIVAKR
jgi:hypothetical protein